MRPSSAQRSASPVSPPDALTLLARVGMRPPSSKHTPGQQHAIWATHTVAAIDQVCSDGERRCEYKKG
jgi:hypothetical protein